MKLQQLTQSRLEDSNAVIKLVCIEVFFKVAQGHTWEVGSCTLASCFTALFAATVDQLVVRVLSLAKCCRYWLPCRMEMATLVLCGNICVDGFASLGEQLLLCCIHCCYCTFLFMHEHNTLLNLLKCLL